MWQPVKVTEATKQQASLSELFKPAAKAGTEKDKGSSQLQVYTTHKCTRERTHTRTHTRKCAHKCTHTHTLTCLHDD